MPIYHVYVPEIHYSKMKIEANSPEEAQELVYNGDGDEIALEFDRTLEKTKYEIHEIRNGRRICHQREEE